MKKSKRTWLWSVDHNDLAGTCYLFGTVHLKAEKVFGFLEAGIQKLEECQAVATEFNLDEAQGRSTGQVLDLPEDYALSDHLSAKRMAKLEKIFMRETGLPIDSFLNMHPFVITSLLTQAIMPNEMSMSLDETIWQLGKDMEKTLHGLETYDSQIALIQKLPLKKQIKQLKDITRQFKNFRKQQKKLVELYAKADLARLNKVALKQAKGFRKLMVFDRNKHMVEQFLEIGKKESLFAAVGAGHLPGEKGMLRLLKKAGCKIKGLKNASL